MCSKLAPKVAKELSPQALKSCNKLAHLVTLAATRFSQAFPVKKYLDTGLAWMHFSVCNMKHNSPSRESENVAASLLPKVKCQKRQNERKS